MKKQQSTLENPNVTGDLFSISVCSYTFHSVVHLHLFVARLQHNKEKCTWTNEVSYLLGGGWNSLL